MSLCRRETCTSVQENMQNRHLEYRLTSPGEGTGNNYAYLVTDDKTKQAVIIDPANPSESVPTHRDTRTCRLTYKQSPTPPEESNRQWHQIDQHHQHSPVKFPYP